MSGDLRSRLARYDTPPVQPVPRRVVSQDEVDEMLRARGGVPVGSGASQYWRIDAQVDGRAWPGTPWAALPADAWRRMGQEPPSGERLAIVDIETTGLESGTGTLAFLVGVIRWQASGARLVQFFLPEPSAEAAMLSDLWDELSQADGFLSYNGRGFDFHRLRTRATLSRLSLDVLERPHLDLVHPARRVASGWMEDCRLATLEDQWLDRGRVDDCPGSLAPEIYLAFLTEGADWGLAGVLDHNRLDVETLMKLAALLAECYGDDPDPMLLPASAQLSMGRALEGRGFVDAALSRYTTAASGVDANAREAVWRQALLLKRAGDAEGAIARLRAVIDEWPWWMPARVELAKLLEHQVRDLDGALGAVDDAIEVLDRATMLGLENESIWSKQLSHRRKRLVRRLRTARARA